MLQLKWITDISKAVWLMELAVLDRTMPAWFRSVVQTKGTILLCRVRISETTGCWWHLSELLSLPMLLQIFPWCDTTDRKNRFHYFRHSTKRNMSCNPVCLLWELKNLLQQKSQLLQKLFIICFPDFLYLCWKIGFYGSCVVTFFSWCIVIHMKKPGCAGPNICHYLFK